MNLERNSSVISSCRVVVLSLDPQRGIYSNHSIHLGEWNTVSPTQSQHWRIHVLKLLKYTSWDEFTLPKYIEHELPSWFLYIQDTQTLRAIFCSWRTDDRIPRWWFYSQASTLIPNCQDRWLVERGRELNEIGKPTRKIAGKIINENRTFSRRRETSSNSIQFKNKEHYAFVGTADRWKPCHLKVCPSLSKIMSVSQCFPLHFPYTSVGPWCCMQSSAHKSYQCAWSNGTSNDRHLIWVYRTKSQKQKHQLLDCYVMSVCVSFMNESMIMYDGWFMSACVISHLRLQRFFFLEPCAACVTLGWSPFRGRVFSQVFFSAHGATARILEVGREGGEKKNNNFQETSLPQNKLTLNKHVKTQHWNNMCIVRLGIPGLSRDPARKCLYKNNGSSKTEELNSALLLSPTVLLFHDVSPSTPELPNAKFTVNPLPTHFSQK